MLTKRIVRRAIVVTAAAIAIASTGPRPEAQSGITITFPARLAAGPDYATDVLNDAWDMSNPEDVSPDPTETAGWSNFSIAGGQAGGTTVLTAGAADSAIGLLFRGHYNVINPGTNGINFPIDTTKFRKISFRLVDSGAGGEIPQVYWFHNAWFDPSGSLGLGVLVAPPTVHGGQIMTVDLSAAPGPGSTAWTTGSTVRGLRIDPNNAHAGQDMFLDWVRLTYADNAAGSAMQTISWTGTGASNIDVIDGAGTVMRIATVATASTFNWNYGVLPPGNYTLRITRSGQTGSRAFTINTPSRVAVTDPSPLTGADYATDVLGNAWDMSTANDIHLTGGENVFNLSFSGGQLHATSVNGGDANITLLGSANNTVPVDTAKYRYLTYKLQVDGPYDLTNGSVARVFWSSSPFLDGFTATTSKDIFVWPGMNSYTIDLATLTTAFGGGLEATGAQEVWTAAPKRQLRLDPHEFVNPRTFHIDDVSLRAKPLSTGSYTIRYSATDVDGDPLTVSLYYDNDRNPSNGKSLIASGRPGGSGTYIWDTSGLPNGDYFIYAESNDTIQLAGRYSDAPVSVSGPVSNPQMSIDGPANGSVAVQPFVVGGWALDAGAPGGTGVDAVHVYAFPAGGAPAIYLGAAQYFGRRDDVGGVFGSRFTFSGYQLSVSTLPQGTYTLAVYAHSTFTNTFNNTRSVRISVPGSLPVMSLDSPGNGATVGQQFVVSGWAADLASPSGAGVDTIHVYAYPNPGSGAAPVFLGGALFPQARTDVGNAFGSRFVNSGYALQVSSLAPGAYRIAVYARSTVAAAFNNVRTADIIVSGPVSRPVITIDTPSNNATAGQPFLLAGWAIDTGSTSGTGIDAIHVWATRVGQPQQFVGIATYGTARADVGAAFGSARYNPSGYTLTVSGLAAGTYDLTVYAHSRVAGAFNATSTVRVTVR
jgi:Big-like domain-containing protein